MFFCSDSAATFQLISKIDFFLDVVAGVGFFSCLVPAQSHHEEVVGS